MPNTAQIADILFKKGLGLGTAWSGFPFFSEPLKGRVFVVPTQIWKDADLIPINVTAPHVSQGVIQRVNNYPLVQVGGTTQAFSGALLVDAIPFNWGTGTGYNYDIRDSTSTQITFGTNDWIIDTEAGILSFNSSVPSNMPPTISFYRYSGAKGLPSTGYFILSGQNVGLGSGLYSGTGAN
jgi:hypothetical protein